MKKLLVELFRRMRAETTENTPDQRSAQQIILAESELHSAITTNSNLPEHTSYLPAAEQTKYYQIDGSERKIAYTISGDSNATKTLLCLPGLLETKNSFRSVHAHFLGVANCEVVSVDFTGRGDSDSLDSRNEYKMSLYLSDVIQLISNVILNSSAKQKKVSVLGTSMGGVLAMYLTRHFGKSIDEVILNDIALTVNWASLYALYKSMKNEAGFKGIRELASSLQVHEHVISGVQQPGHFDLPYKADVWGMNFHEALAGYKGKIALIYGEQSKICTKQRVLEARAHIPNLKTFSVADAAHPAPLNEAVCNFIQQEMGLS
jgi:pimeloyl-ACP methyl ester carboxylesterase